MSEARAHAIDLNLRGKIAVVTGASKGIGLAITKALVAEGARDVGGELGALASRGAVRAASVDLAAPDGAGAIVTVSSVNAFLPDPGVIDYCAAKAALTNFRRRCPSSVPRGFG